MFEKGFLQDLIDARNPSPSTTSSAIAPSGRQWIGWKSTDAITGASHIHVITWPTPDVEKVTFYSSDARNAGGPFDIDSWPAAETTLESFIRGYCHAGLSAAKQAGQDTERLMVGVGSRLETDALLTLNEKLTSVTINVAEEAASEIRSDNRSYMDATNGLLCVSLLETPLRQTFGWESFVPQFDWDRQKLLLQNQSFASVFNTKSRERQLNKLRTIDKHIREVYGDTQTAIEVLTRIIDRKVEHKPFSLDEIEDELASSSGEEGSAMVVIRDLYNLHRAAGGAP